MALPGDPPGELQVVDGHPEGGEIPELTGMASAFTPDYAPSEMFEIASRLYKAAGGSKPRASADQRAEARGSAAKGT